MDGLFLSQAEIQKWSNILDEERQQFETLRSEVNAAREEQTRKAATAIQKHYRGYRFGTLINLSFFVVVKSKIRLAMSTIWAQKHVYYFETVYNMTVQNIG